MEAPEERQGTEVVLQAPAERRSLWVGTATSAVVVAACIATWRIVHGEPWLPSLGTLGVVLLFALWVWQRNRETFTLTAEGIRHRRPGLDRSLAWSDVARAETDGDRAFLLHAADGSTLRVPLDLTGIDDLAGALRRHVPSGIGARPAADLEGRAAGTS